MSAKLPVEDRFWAKVEKGEGCWEWIASKGSHGYGAIWNQGRLCTTHRFSYELAYGPIPEGAVIDHMCHRRSCVNPKHLRAVTHKENIENRAGAQINNKHGVRGVRRLPGGRWEARVNHHGVTHRAGIFDTLEEAGDAAAAKRNELYTPTSLGRIAS